MEVDARTMVSGHFDINTKVRVLSSSLSFHSLIGNSTPVHRRRRALAPILVTLATYGSPYPFRTITQPYASKLSCSVSVSETITMDIRYVIVNVFPIHLVNAARFAYQRNGNIFAHVRLFQHCRPSPSTNTALRGRIVALDDLL